MNKYLHPKNTETDSKLSESPKNQKVTQVIDDDKFDGNIKNQIDKTKPLIGKRTFA